MEAWLLVAVVFSILYVFWVVLDWTFQLIDRAHAAQRAAQPSADDGGKRTREREH